MNREAGRMLLQRARQRADVVRWMLGGRYAPDERAPTHELTGDHTDQPALADFRRVAALARDVARMERLSDALEALVSAALELTAFGCGQVYTCEDGVWTGHGGAQCGDVTSCPVCNTDPRFATVADGIVVLDRDREPGRGLLADATPELAKVLVAPVPLDADQRCVVVIRSDDVSADVTPRTLELVSFLTAQAAIAIEHHRRLEAERRRVRELRHLDALTTEFVQLLAHDLRTPMTTIGGYAGTLLEHWSQLDEEPRTRMLTGITREIDRLSRLTEDVTGTILGHEDTLPIHSSALDLAALVREVAADPSCEAGVDIEISARSGIPPATADRDRVSQILHNLCANAQKFSPPGSTVTVTIEPVDDHVELAVIDQGPGIPPGEVDTVFERFGRCSNAGGVTGSGLGMYASRQLAERMGGSLTVDTSHAPGARFVLRLPAADTSNLVEMDTATT